ncbi:unnamed protein product [Musa acuminata var. zebrina]
MTAPPIALSTTPPATMLSRKFLRDGDRPGWAASATSGITNAAAKAAAVNPASACSFTDDGVDEEARTWRERRWGLGVCLPAFVGVLMEWKKASEPETALFWVAEEGEAKPTVSAATADAIGLCLQYRRVVRREEAEACF